MSWEVRMDQCMNGREDYGEKYERLGGGSNSTLIKVAMQGKEGGRLMTCRLRTDRFIFVGGQEVWICEDDWCVICDSGGCGPFLGCEEWERGWQAMLAQVGRGWLDEFEGTEGKLSSLLGESVEGVGNRVREEMGWGHTSIL